MTLLLPCLLLSVDSLVVSFALAPVVSSSKTRLLFAMLFGVCDGAAVIAGSHLNLGTWASGVSELAGPLALIVCGVYFLVAASWNRLRVNPFWVTFLPLVMSLDNLAFGAHPGNAPQSLLSHAFWLGLSSFALSLLGFACSRIVTTKNERQWIRLTGLMLVSYSVILAVS